MPPLGDTRRGQATLASAQPCGLKEAHANSYSVANFHFDITGADLYHRDSISVSYTCPHLHSLPNVHARSDHNIEAHIYPLPHRYLCAYSSSRTDPH